MNETIVPSLFVKNRGEDSVKIALKMTTARERWVVRFTGGCGLMSPEDAEGLYDLFETAFAGFGGAMLFGGTRMLRRDDHSVVVPGITEVVHRIRKANPASVSLGVVPRTQELSLRDYGMVVEDGMNPWVTIIHPIQDMCLMVQSSTDHGVPWEAEFEECMDITHNLRTFAGFQSLLVCYNGGCVTEKELLATAARGWPVLLVKGSGRKTDEYAANSEFLLAHPNVRVAQCSAMSIRSELVLLGMLPPSGLHLVRKTSA